MKPAPLDNIDLGATKVAFTLPVPRSWFGGQPVDPPGMTFTEPPPPPRPTLAEMERRLAEMTARHRAKAADLGRRYGFDATPRALCRLGELNSAPNWEAWMQVKLRHLFQDEWERETRRWVERWVIGAHNFAHLDGITVDNDWDYDDDEDDRSTTA